LNGPLTRALIVEEPHESLDALLRAQDFTVVRVDESPSPPELIAMLRQGRHQVLFKRSRVQVTRQVIESCPELVAIQLCCIGHDSVDKQACADNGVLVFNDPVSNGRSVVEMVIGQLIALSRDLFITNQQAHAGIWDKGARGRFEVLGKTLGIWGLGRIGRRVARIAESLGMTPIFLDSREVAQEVGEELEWDRVESPEELFRRSDCVTLHVSAEDCHGSENAGIVSRELLMQLGADRPEDSPRILINLSRGVVMAPQDLISAIQMGAVRRAAVDVFPVEPGQKGPGWENPYARIPQVVTTPHIGAATVEAQPRIASRVARTAGYYATRGVVRDCIYSPRTLISMTEELSGRCLLLVLHATTRGTKKALDDAIFEAQADNLRSQHRDFARWGVALDVNLLDRPLSPKQLQRIVDHTAELTGDPTAVRLVRQIPG
jgi:D-3-phosphoglycerate dehydrogenase